MGRHVVGWPDLAGKICADHFFCAVFGQSLAMADDDMLLNFEVGDGPAANLVASQYKGRWKERALSKKWDRIQARRAFKGPAKPSISSTDFNECRCPGKEYGYADGKWTKRN